MKHKMPTMLLACVLLSGFAAGLSSCGQDEEIVEPGDKDEDKVVINSVKITDMEGNEIPTIVADNSDIDLKATVSFTGTDKDAKRVTWKSSDETVATVTNGNVAFNKIDGEKTVKITATSKVDTTKSAEVTFTVKHVAVNVSDSKPDSLDTSEYLETGLIKQNDKTQDTALMFADIHHTKFYAEAEFRLNETDPADAWPKFGMMIGTNKKGAWNNQEDANAFYYIDFRSDMPNNWSTINMVGCNEEKNDWVWSGHPNSTSATNVDAVIKSKQYIKIGLLRDGVDYFLYFGTSEDNYATFKCYKQIRWEGIAAETPTYAWLGGWRTSADAKNFKAIVDPEAVDAMIKAPTSVTITEEGLQEIAPKDTLQLHVTTAPADSRGEIEWTSSNPEKIAVDAATGKVTALEGAALGDTATITASLKGNAEVKSTIEVVVKVPGVTQTGNVEYTDDQHFKIGTSDADLMAGMNANKVVLAKKIKTNNFDLHYTIKNFKFRNDGEGAYWPKATLELNGDMLALGKKAAPNDTYVRFESCIAGGWHNSNNYEPALTEETQMTLKVRNGVVSAYINGTQMAVNFNGGQTPEEMVRTLDQKVFAEKDGYEIAFTSDCCTYEISHLDITEYTGNIQILADDHFIIGDQENPAQGFFQNGVTYGPLITYKNFDVTYKISNVKIPTTGQGWPKGAFVVNGDFICLGHKTEGENYVRVETNTGAWNNSDHLEDSTVDGKTFEMKISVRDLAYTVEVNGQLMKIANGEGTTRYIKDVPGQGGIKYAITSENMSMEISDFAITEIVE